MQALDILARISDPNKEMKSKVGQLFIDNVFETLRLSVDSPSMLFHSSFMMDHEMDQKRDRMQLGVLMVPRE